MIKTLIFSLVFLFGLNPTSEQVVGNWISEAKDLKVQVYKSNGKYFGKIIWFKVETKGKSINDFKDKENPNAKLKSRPWLGMTVLENLKFNNEGYWNEGTIYDPNSGKTYGSTVKLIDSDHISVRGYWGFEIIGKSMKFYREK